LDLARIAARGSEHTLVSAHDFGAEAAMVQRELPQVRLAEHWEELLANEQVDAVIVARAGDDDARADQLRKLFQAGVPLVVSHPVHDSMLVYYELEMIREESRSFVYPYVPGLGHPALSKLQELLGSASFGRLEQLLIEKELPERNRRNVLSSLVRDIQLVATLSGKLSKVGAMAPGEATERSRANYSNLSVQMSGPAGALVRWSVVPVESSEGTRFNFVGAGGKAALFVPCGAQPWTLQTRFNGSAATRTFDPWDSAAFALAQVAGAISGSRTQTSSHLQSDWLAASRTMELADAVEHSLQRGRTIDLHYEAPTEQSTFKGLMAGIGCFLLIGGLLFTVVAAVLQSLRIPLTEHWPKLLLGVLGAFLLLQLFRFAFPPAAEERNSGRGDEKKRGMTPNRPNSNAR
jgi:myo-inositol 2-dehydrogenase/D-chiro-inositol 1-dehydrogenase